MQLNRFTLRGFGPFDREISLDLDSLNGKLVAVIGENGAGKTTMLEVAFAGAIFRDCPTRGSLVNLAGDNRNAYVESVITNGQQYRIRQMVDGLSKKGESSVTDASGKALTVSAKLSEFDAWRAAGNRFPDEDVFYSSIFTPQAFGGFLALKPADRKKIILRVLGIEHYEALSETARDRAKDVRVKLENARARLSELSGKMSIEDAEYEVSMQQGVADECQATLTLKRANLDTARIEAERIRAEIQRIEGDQKRRREVTERIAGLRASLLDLQTRLKNNRDLLSNEDAVREAVARLEQVNESLSTLTAERERLAAEYKASGESVADLIHRAQDAESRASQARQRAGRHQDTLKDSDAVTKAVEALPDLETALRSAEHNEKIARELVDTLAGEKVDSLSDRVTVYRNDMITIRDGLKGTESSLLMSIARGSVEDHDRANDAAAEHPAKLTNARAALAEWTANVKARREALTKAERLAARATEIESAAKELEAAQHEAIEQDEAARTYSAHARNAKAEVEEKAAAVENCKAEIAKLQREKVELQETTKTADKLAGAKARIDEYVQQEAGLERDIQTAEAELKEISNIETLPGSPDITGIERDVATAETVSREAFDQLALAQAKVTEAEQVATRRAELQIQQSRHEIEFADWTRLTEDFGRDGLQALEIDAAGPELSETINDLLRTCIGPRWTVSVETTRMSSDKKKQIEGCDVIVADNEKGKLLSGESLSGGQKVIIGEAISLALSMFSLRRAGITGATLVRDESGAALSPGYAPKYLAMLRRASEIVGASKILFVSHNPEAHELADSVVRVNDDGTITVVR